MNNQTDALVVAGLRQGNQQSFQVIFNMHYAGQCVFATQIIHDAQEAEEIASCSFVKLWTLRGNFSNSGEIRAFLYVTTRNACLNYLKHSKTQTERAQNIMSLATITEDSILTEITRTEVVREVYAAIETLPPKCGEIIRLSFVQGLGNNEIADLLSLSVHTVKNQKHRGIMLLRQKLVKMGAIAVWLFLQNEYINYNC